MSLCRLVLGHALFVVAASSVAIAGCGSDTQPTPKAFIDARVRAGGNGSAVCGVVDPTWVEIGTAATSVSDGSNDANGVKVSVSCSVTSNGDGTFKVNAVGTLGNVGSVTITGNFATSGTQNNIRAVFQRSDGRFEQTDCTATYQSLTPTGVLTDNGFAGVAAGRVWATVHCPTASDASQQRQGQDGGATPRACDGLAEFKFENCGQ